MGTPVLIASSEMALVLYAAGWIAFWTGAVIGWKVDRDPAEGIVVMTIAAMAFALIWPAIVAYLLLATALRLIGRMFAA